METLGYRNAQKVMRLSAEGKFLTMFRGNPTPNMTAYAMMLTMAEITYDWPSTEENQRKGLPSRVYERGWGHLAEQFSMGILSHEALQREDNGRLIASRRQSAIQRISQTGMFLQSQGLIKKIRKEDVRREIPAAWLLLIGDDEENREVEAYARECLGLSSC